MLRKKSTSSYLSRHLGVLAKRQLARTASRTSSERGFTLIELMVVVIIIALLAVVAVPSAAGQYRNYRAKGAAENIAAVFREARLRAMGRGSAMMVQFDPALDTFTVREAIAGNLPAGCQQLPNSACTPFAQWTTAGMSQQISVSDYGTSGTYVVGGTTTSGTVANTLSVCFSPLGRAYDDSAAMGVFAEMSSPIQFSLRRATGRGIQRSILVSPVGTARVVATP